MSLPEAAPANQIERVTELLKSAAKPMTFLRLRKSSRLKDAELKGALEAALEQSVIFRWPDYRRSQYFWSKSADNSAQDVLLAVASREAFSRSELIRRACAQMPGFSQKAMDRIVGNLIASRALQPVPAFTSGKLLIRAGSVAPYVASARKFIEDKFRRAGLSSAELFAPSLLATPAAPASPGAATIDICQQILDLVQSIEPVTGVPVTTQRLRRGLPDLTKQEFDTATLELRRQHKVSLSLHHDPHNLPEADRDLLIDGRDGNYYVAIAIRG